MDTTENHPAKLYKCGETGITIVQHKHTKILESKGKHQMSSLQSAERVSLVTVVIYTYQSNWTRHSSITCYLKKKKKKKKTRTDEWHTAWINPRLSSLGVDTERDFFFQWFISSNIQSRQKKILSL
jgi:hypothetical protein